MDAGNRFETIRQLAAGIRADRVAPQQPKPELLGLDEVMDEDRRRGFIHPDKKWAGHVKNEAVARNGGRE